MEVSLKKGLLWRMVEFREDYGIWCFREGMIWWYLGEKIWYGGIFLEVYDTV